MRALFVHICMLSGLLASTAAKSDVLNQPVSLRTEGDLIQAVSVTLQHAVATSQQYKGSEPRLQRFAREEISARRKPEDVASYLRAMLRNHAWLIELIEYGEGLPLSKNTRRLTNVLGREATAEFSMLSTLEES